MLEIILLDDDAEALKRLRQETEAELEQRGFTAAFHEALAPETVDEILGRLENLDLAMLDIDMGTDRPGGGNGLQAAAVIRSRFPACSIVFVTSYLTYATEIYEVQPIYFILKDQLHEKLSQAVELFLQLQARKQKYLKVNVGKTEKLIPVEAILYIERENRRSKIVTQSEETVVWDNLQQLYEQLPQERFAACHKSYIVGLRWVSNYDRFYVTLTTGQTLPISRSHKETFRKSVALFMISDIQG